MENQMDLASAADEDVVSQDSAVDLKEEEDDEVDSEEGSDEEEEEEEGDEDDSSDAEEDDEDGDEDEGEEEDDEEEDVEEEMEEGDSQLDASQESDFDGEDLPTCPICLDKLRSQDIGSPESCDHQFCMQCIIEWSRNVNTCPVDRQPFNIILARHPGEDKVFKRINVENHQMSEEAEALPEEEEDTTECEVCNESDREDRLLLCDGCDLAYHCECLTPPLTTVPVEEWFCPTCAEVNSRMAVQAAAAAEEEEDDAFMSFPRRQIARTRVSERVRQRIQALRMQHRRLLESSDEDEMEVSEEITPSPSVSTSRASSSACSTTRRKTTRKKTTRRKTTRRKTSKRRKTSRKRKTPTKTKAGTGTGKKATRRKGKKRKTKRRKKTTKRKTPAIPQRPGFSITSQAFSAPMSRTIKGRIAERLGLSKPPPGRTIPMQRRPGERAVDVKRGDYGTAPLSILGDTNELIAFPDVEDYTPHVLPAARAASTVVLSRPPIAIQHAVKKPIPASRITQSAPASFDLLGSIFKDQSILHMDSSSIHIKRDGSLEATKPVKVRNFEKPPSPVPRARRISDLIALESGRSRSEPSDTGESPNNAGSSDSGGSSDNGGSGEDNSASGGSNGDGNGDNSAKDSDHSGSGEGGGGAGEDSGGSGGGSGDGSNGGSGDDEDGERQGSPDNEEEGEREDSEEEQNPQEEEDEMESKPDADRQEDHGEEQAQREFEMVDNPAEETAEDKGDIQNAEEENQSDLTEMNIETHDSAGSNTGPKASTESEREEGEISMSPAVTPTSSATSLQETNAGQGNVTQNVENQDNNSGGTAVADETTGRTRRRRERRKNRWSDIVKEDEGTEEGEVKMPQEVTTPFSLASFLSHVDPQEMQTGGEQVEEAPTSSQEGEEEREFTFTNGTFARVNKNRVDEQDLDRRLDDIFEQRRVERGLLRMYGVSDREDQLGEGEPVGSADGDATKENDGKDKNRDADDRPREGRRRSGSRSRDRDRDRDRRRSRSRDRRRSRSRDRRRSRSRSRDRSNRRPRESGEDAASGRSRDEKDRFGRDKDRFGRDRRDQDRGGRDKDDKKDPTKERGRRSRSPRDRRIDNRDSREVNRERQTEKEEDDRFTKAGWRTGGGGGRGGRDGGGWRDRGGRGGGRDRDGGRGGRFGGNRQSDWSEGKGEGGFGQHQGPKYGWNDQEGGRSGGGGGRGWNKPDQMRGGGAGRGWNDPEKHGSGAGRGGQGWNHKPEQQTPGGMGAGGGAGFIGGQDFFSHQQNQFQQPPPSLLHQDLPYGQQPPFRGNQPPGLFNQPPPSLDPFAAAGPVPVPPPPQSGTQLPPPGGFQPWLGTAFQQQQALPTNQQTLSSAQQAPPPPPGMMGDYSQPPPPLPRELNLLNNGDFDTLKKSLLLLTGGSDPNTPVSGSPGLVGATQQGFGGVGSISDVSANVPPPPALGERHSGFGGGESGIAETSGSNGEGDPMELELPSGSKNDFQERVVEEVKSAIRPHFNSRHISKEEYKEILKKCVPKVCNSGEINSKKISNLVSAYVKKMRAARAK